MVLVLALVAAANADSLPIIGAGIAYEAEFSEAAGLAVDDEVRVAGVKVGKVVDVGLDGGSVRVRFKVEDTWLGDRTTAAIKIKTLLGQKYLALDPLGAAPLEDVIPRERTVAPYDVLDAFRDLSTTVRSLDTEGLARSFEVLAEALPGGPTVRGALSGLTQLSETIASRNAALSRLLANTAAVSRTLSDRDSALVRLLSDGNLVLAEVAARTQAISTLLAGARELSRQVRGMVDDNDVALRAVLGSLDQLTGMLQRNQESLATGVARLAPLIRYATNATGHGHWGDTYVCLPVVSACY
ncbi:ABC transporter substrate-binding protein [Amycolatopsis deserti]|uniref:ABC transporter substrate-binding protein n=1 Tax=Amycolatopsis deserti TaxID=185696 RepID=A0ABQ3JC41_9PSEU|nr:ABC transporter substrate-binding protein [Amycolatopsis deserti]